MLDVAAGLLVVALGLMALRYRRARARMNRRLQARMRSALAAEAAPVAVRVFGDARPAHRPLHPRLVPLTRPEE